MTVRQMVEDQLRRRGILDERVLDAMARIPRELFVPERERSFAYQDAPIGIGFGQTISQPYMTAFMCQALELRGDEVVLDVGTGSGYHAAVLSMLADRVHSIEMVPELCEQARRNLERAGLAERVALICGDGSRGYPEAAPYDGISVAAGAPDIPPALVDQLAEGGRLVIPVGTLEEQDLLVVRKRQGRTETRRASGCRFVPLRGSQGWPDER